MPSSTTMHMPGMDMPGPTRTVAYTPPGASATGSAMSGGGGGGGGGTMGPMQSGAAHGCKISMLWNWNTVDSCFLSAAWRIRSAGGFAALCLGVVLMVVLLEALRRAAKAYDRALVRAWRADGRAALADAADDDHHHHHSNNCSTAALHPAAASKSNNTSKTKSPFSPPASLLRALRARLPGSAASASAGYRPTLPQQLVRAALHTLQFALAYWIMLMAMYYNGYVIICIVIGAFVGAFVFQWDHLGDGCATPAGDDPRDVTGCCG